MTVRMYYADLNHSIIVRVLSEDLYRTPISYSLCVWV